MRPRTDGSSPARKVARQAAAQAWRFPTLGGVSIEKGHDMTAEPEERAESLGAEKRKGIRYCCKLTAARSGTGTVAFKPSRLARALDISRYGIAIHVYEPYEVGAILVIRLYASLGEPISPDMEIRLVHTTPQANGTWVGSVACLGSVQELEQDFIAEIPTFHVSTTALIQNLPPGKYYVGLAARVPPGALGNMLAAVGGSATALIF
jgi:hypothetical protein